MGGYAYPDAIVETEWLAEHLNDPTIRIIESNEDILLYDQGHIPGAVKIDWITDLNDQVQRDYLDRASFEALCRSKGISNDMTLVFYGDHNNWWATYALWVFELFGHRKMCILNGGRSKWITEGRELTRVVPNYPPTTYSAPERDDTRIRIFRDEVRQLIGQAALVDVRSSDEYTGKKLHMPEYPQEGALRGGHIPSARSIPWARAVNPDGTFKSVAELQQLYANEGITPDKEVIAYCRIGERSSHTWFVLTYLLGYPHVRNYDGSWTEWGNGVGLPIER